MEIKKTTDVKLMPTINMLIYGAPGVGKTTFSANTEDCLIADVEGGAVFLGLHGIEASVARVEKWDDLNEVLKAVKEGGYKTVVIDPIGELLEKLIDSLKKNGYGQGRGETLTLSLQGWGVAKEQFKTMMRKFRDINCNVILVAHTNEKKDEERTTVRPKMQASLDEDVCAMMHIVGFMKLESDGKKTTRKLYMQPTEKYYAKDRIGLLPAVMEEPTFNKVRDTIINNEFFSKALVQEVKEDSFLVEK